MSVTQLADEAWHLVPNGQRTILGLTGAPGAGKSTLAKALAKALGERAAYVPLDGFHLSNTQLDHRGLHHRKGSEPSFDAAGYAALLHRLLTTPEEPVYVPDFDRALDEPIAARHLVSPEARLIITEGNYLACDLPGWREARKLMTQVWYVDAPAAVRDARLMERHTGFGRTPEASRAWIDTNDAPNAQLVEATRAACERTVPGAPAAGGELILVSGPSGAGKSTVAQLLADSYPLSVHLHTDDFWSYIRQGAIPPYRPSAQQQNKVVMDVLAGAALAYAEGGYRVILDGVIGPWFIDVFRTAAEQRGIALHYAVLRPDEPTTLARGTSRGPEALTDPAPLRDLHGQFADLGPYENHAIDSTSLDARSTAAAVQHAVAGGTLLL